MQESLSDAQKRFAHCMGFFLEWVDLRPDWAVTFGDFMAHDGHMANSCHYIRLAADLNLFVDGIYRKDTEAYREMGEKWKTFDPLARWGGDFPKPDGNHFSFAWQGRA